MEKETKFQPWPKGKKRKRQGLTFRCCSKRICLSWIHIWSHSQVNFPQFNFLLASTSEGQEKKKKKDKKEVPQVVHILNLNKSRQVKSTRNITTGSTLLGITCMKSRENEKEENTRHKTIQGPLYTCFFSSSYFRWVYVPTEVLHPVHMYTQRVKLSNRCRRNSISRRSESERKKFKHPKATGKCEPWHWFVKKKKRKKANIQQGLTHRVSHCFSFFFFLLLPWSSLGL